MTSRVRMCLAGLLALAALVIAGCGGDDGGGGDGDAGGGGVISLGAPLELSGDGQQYGAGVLIGYEIAAEEINAAGGVNGSEIEIVTQDIRSEEQDGVTVTRELVGDGVVGIVGPTLSNIQAVVYPIGNQLEVPVVLPSGGVVGNAAENRPWAFKTHVTEEKVSAVGLDVMTDCFDVQEVILLVDTAASAWVSYIDTITPALEDKNLEVVGRVEWETDAADFSAQVQRLQDIYQEGSNRGLVAGANYNEFARFLVEMDRQGLDPNEIPIYGGPGAFTNEFVELAGESGQGVIVAQSYWPDNPTEANREFTERYAEKAPSQNLDPDTATVWAANAYDTLRLMAQVFEEQGVDGGTPPDEARELLREGLDEATFEGVTGTIEILENGEATRAEYPVLQVTGDGYELVEGCPETGQ